MLGIEGWINTEVKIVFRDKDRDIANDALILDIDHDSITFKNLFTGEVKTISRSTFLKIELSKTKQKHLQEVQ